MSLFDETLDALLLHFLLKITETLKVVFSYFHISYLLYVYTLPM